MGFQLRDGSLRRQHVLPNGAATTAGQPIDTGTTASLRAQFVAECESIVTTPAPSTAQLPDGQTVTYRLQHSDDVAFGAPQTVADIRVQVGAGGAGASGQAVRARLPAKVQRYVRLATVEVGAANASAATVTMEVAFRSNPLPR